MKFSVIGSVPHQSTSRFESHRRFCVGNIFPTNANFPSPNARKISIVASFFMCCTVPPLRYAYINKNNNNNYYYFLWINRSSLLRKMDPGLGSEFENKQHDGNFSVIVLETKTVSDLCLHQSLTILRQLLLAFGYLKEHVSNSLGIIWDPGHFIIWICGSRFSICKYVIGWSSRYYTEIKRYYNHDMKCIKCYFLSVCPVLEGL